MQIVSEFLEIVASFYDVDVLSVCVTSIKLPPHL